MNTILLISQIAVSVFIIILIAIQNSGTALGAGFGGSGESYSSRRGAQKKIFYATVVLTAIFILLGIVNLLV